MENLLSWITLPFAWSFYHTIALFVWYLGAMFVLRRKHRLREKLGPFFYVLVMLAAGGFPIDVIYQWTVGIVYFRQVTWNLTLSGRLRRYRDDEKYNGTWRRSHAKWICEHLLNKYDPKKIHC